jgi:hypothetical protein
MLKGMVGAVGGLVRGGRAHWLRRSTAVAALAVVLTAGVPQAQAGWSPAARVLGQGHFGDAVVAFDAQSTPWVAWSVAPEHGVSPSGLFVAQLTGRDRLASVNRVPGPHLEEVVSPPAFAVDSAGFGVLAWQYVTEYGLTGLNGAAVATWPIGGAPSRPTELVAPTRRMVGPVSLATDRQASTIVLYSEFEVPQAESTTRAATIDAARVHAGRVLRRQRIATIADGATPLQAQVAPGVAEGFQANWELEGDESDHFAALGADTSQGTANGSFSAARLTPWPVGFTEATYRSQQLIDGPHGDQVAWWTAGPEDGTQRLYVASRRQGESFSAPQLIGRIEGVTPRPDVVISRAGRFTIAWAQPAGARLSSAMAEAGSVGGKLHAARLLSPGSNLGGMELVLTQAGEAVASWWQELPSGELLAQAATSADDIRFTAPHTIFRRPAHPALACGGPSLWPDRRDGVLAGWTCSQPGVGQHEFEEFSHYQP